jgi:hypothetical protein
MDASRREFSMRKSRKLAPIVNTPIHRAEVLAIEALDELTGKLIKTHTQVPPEFLDWVGADATHFARQLVHQSMKNVDFARDMQSAQAQSTILRLIHDGVMPLVQHRFVETLTGYARPASTSPPQGSNP